MFAAIKDTAYYTPDCRLTNEELCADFPTLTPKQVENVTGIAERPIAAADEHASDLAVKAGLNLFAQERCAPGDIDQVVLCTQTPDYILPSTACIVQERLGIETTCGAFDITLGCSAFVVGLGISKGFIESGQAKKVLLLTADTLTKYIHPRDRSVRPLFGDAGTATLIEGVDAAEPLLGPFVFGTDGRGVKNLIVPAGGTRIPRTADTAVASEQESKNIRSMNDLFMDGAEVFTFTLRVVPSAVRELLAKAGLMMSDIDYFVFHQANGYILDVLRKKLAIPDEKFLITMKKCGIQAPQRFPLCWLKRIVNVSLHQVIDFCC